MHSVEIRLSSLHFIGLSVGLLAAVTACESSKLEPQAEALAPFTIELRDRQPEDAFTAVYPVNGGHLVWLGAKHANRTDSLTFQLIETAYSAFKFETVIVEGCPASWEPNAQRLIAYARAGAAEEKDGFQPRGEIVPAALGALNEGAAIYCGEPEDEDLKSRVLKQGIQALDLLGFYTMRSIPQWIREQKIVDAADPAIGALLEKELARNRGRLGLADTVLPTVDAWREWYQATNGKALGADFSTEEAGPLADGPFGSNTVAAAISRARAVFLHEIVLSHLNDDQTVLVVFGASHLMIHRPALDATLGAPCYAGEALGDAVALCN